LYWSVRGRSEVSICKIWKHNSLLPSCTVYLPAVKYRERCILTTPGFIFPTFSVALPRSKVDHCQRFDNQSVLCVCRIYDFAHIWKGKWSFRRPTVVVRRLPLFNICTSWTLLKSTFNHTGQEYVVNGRIRALWKETER
jgi:hypothetical protein